MTKQEIIDSIADRTGLERQEVSVVVEAFMEEVRSAMADRKDSVYLRGFGTFNVTRRAPKVGRIITRNTSIQIPARDVPTFKPSNAFVSRMQKGGIE